ncbi:MAG: protein kinase [Myxococcota bacterium]|nr:protein kinase [Myxococcota bacterium]
MSQSNRKGNHPGRIGRYEVLRKIASGGMAELFLAKKTGMDGFEKVVAIKQILPHLSHEEEFVNMFRDEARIVAKLSHPNIVQIFDLGKSEDSYFIAMEYISGRNLSSVAKRAKAKSMKLEPVYVARCMAQVCEGLYYAHNRKEPDGKPLRIVHRDVSPQNIILAFSGQTKIVDFGIAKAATKIAHTRHGVLKGKYAYMSPEQIRGEKIDARSDLFAVGVVLFELLCGQRPFEKDNSIQTLKSIVQEPHISPFQYNSDLDPELVSIIDRCLTKKRDERYQTGQEVQIALEDYVAGSGKRASNLAISKWLNELFAEDLQKSQGAKINFKGIGDVILPDDDSKPGSAASKPKNPSAGPVAPSVRREARAVVTAASKPAARDPADSIPPPSSAMPPPSSAMPPPSSAMPPPSSAMPPPSSAMPPPSAPSQNRPTLRAGGALVDKPPIPAPSSLRNPTERRPSTQGLARANLIEEGVIIDGQGKLPPLPDQYTDDATAIAPSVNDAIPSPSVAPAPLPPPSLVPLPPSPPLEDTRERQYSEGTREGLAEKAEAAEFEDGATEFAASFIEDGGTEESVPQVESVSETSQALTNNRLSDGAEESPEEIAARMTNTSTGGLSSRALAEIEQTQSVTKKAPPEVAVQVVVPSPPALPPMEESNDPLAEPTLPRPEMRDVDVDADSRTMATADYEAFEAELARREAEEAAKAVSVSAPQDDDPFEDELNAISAELRRSASQASLPRLSSTAESEKEIEEEEEEEEYDIDDEDETTAMPSVPRPPPNLSSLMSETKPRASGLSVNPKPVSIPAPEPKSEHPNSGIGSERVPPANVSLSEMLVSRSENNTPSSTSQTNRLVTNPHDSSIGMPEPETQAEPAELDDLPLPEPICFQEPNQPAEPRLRHASITPRKGVRSIRETTRTPNASEKASPVMSLATPSRPAPPERKGQRMAGAGTGLGEAKKKEGPSKVLRGLKIALLVLLSVGAAGSVTWVLLKLRVPTLMVETEPPGARVFLDDKLVPGATPIDLEVTPGKKHNLKVIHEGYDEAVRTVKVRNSIAPSKILIKLIKTSPAQAPPTQ